MVNRQQSGLSDIKVGFLRSRRTNVCDDFKKTFVCARRHKRV